MAPPPELRLGLCSFSCHQHWRAVAARDPAVKFHDAAGFYAHARDLGADGVQAPLGSTDERVARELRERVEATAGFFEAELRLPEDEGDVGRFETDVRLAREAGAAVARTYFTIERRYEAWATPAEFQAFADRAVRRVHLAEPVLRRHRLPLAIENHKDFTSAEFVGLLRAVDSEWIGATVDLGNNLSLLEAPHEPVAALAPWARSVHLKDMAVQPAPDGFLLSEVPAGSGLLDLRHLVAVLHAAHPHLALNLEMATRDPLRVPCLTDAYYATFPSGYRAERLAPALERVQAHPPRGPVPAVSGKPLSAVLADEESANRDSLAWLRQHLRP